MRCWNVLLSFLCCLLTVPAVGDRLVLPPADISVSEPGQKAVIAYNGEEEILVLKTDLKSNKKRLIVEMLPFPSPPEATLASSDFMEKFQELIRAKELRFGPVYRSAGSRKPPEIELLSHQQLGPHDLRVIKVTNISELWKYLDPILKEKGLQRPPLSETAKLELERYTQEGYIYFAVDIVEVQPSTVSVAPIVYRFKSKTLFYPLRTSNAVGGDGVVELYFLLSGGSDSLREAVGKAARHLMSLTFPEYRDEEPENSWEPGETSYKFTWAANVTPEELEQFVPDFQGFFPGNAILQAHRYEGALKFEEDVDLERSGLGLGPAHLAAEAGDLDALKASIAKEPELIGYYDCFYQTPLHYGVGSGEEIVRVLLDAGADPNIGDDQSRTPLFLAVDKKLWPIATLLLSRGAELDTASGYEKQTALHVAASTNRLDILQYYLDKGALIDKADRYGRTPLWAAATAGHVEAVSYLVEAGASLNTQDTNGETPLTSARNKKVFVELLERGASLTLTNKDGNGPVDKALSKGWGELVTRMFEKGATLNKSRAVFTAHPSLLKLALENGADPNAVDRSGSTRLHQVVVRNDIDQVKLLLEYGADKDARNGQGKRPVDLARDPAIQALLK